MVFGSVVYGLLLPSGNVTLSVERAEKQQQGSTCLVFSKVCAFHGFQRFLHCASHDDILQYNFLVPLLLDAFQLR